VEPISGLRRAAKCPIFYVCFFPYQMLMNMLPWFFWDYFLLGRLLFAGIFTCLFLFECGLSAPAAILGGIMFMLSGSMVWFINLQQYMNVAMLLPLLMYCLEKLLSTSELAWRAWLAISVGLVLLAGQPEAAAYVLLFACCYAACRIYFGIREKKAALRKSFLFVSCCIAGACLAACVIIPFIEYTRNAFCCHQPGSAMGTVTPAPWNLLICILMPHLTEVPAFLRYFPHNGVWDYLGGYTGAGIMFLAILSLFSSKKRRALAYFFFIAAAIIIAKNAGLSAVNWIGRLPLLEQVWSNRWAGPVWVFSLCCAAAIGAEEISLAGLSLRKAACMIAAVVLAAVVFLFAHRLIFYYHFNVADFLSIIPDELLKFMAEPQNILGPSAPYLRAAGVFAVMLLAMLYVIIYGSSKKDILYGLFFLVLAELWFCIPRAMDVVWTGYKSIPFACAVASALFVCRNKRLPAGLMITVAAIVAVLIDIVAPWGFPRRADPFPETPCIRFLKEHTKEHSRIIAGDNILMPNYASAYRLPDIRYADSMSPKEFQSYVNNHLLTTAHRAPTQQLWFSGRADDFKTNPPSIYDEIISHRRYYDFLGLAYVVAVCSVDMGWPLVYDAEVKIYENPNRFPRAYIAHSIRYAKSPQEAQEAMGLSDFDLLSEAIVEDKGIFLDKAFNPSQNHMSFNPRDEGRLFSAREETAGFTPRNFTLPSVPRAKITAYAPDSVIIHTESDRPGILVLTDVFYPGWRAFIDGRRVKIYRVNGLVRGVLIGEGNHTVQFKYQPLSFYAGLAAGLAGACFCIWLLIKKKACP